MNKVNIKNAIIETLQQSFELPVDSGKIELMSVIPRFRVREIKRVHENQVGEFHRINHSFLIEYFPSMAGDESECWEIEFELMKIFKFYEKLKLIPSSMLSEMVDDVLQFNIDFNIRYTTLASDAVKLATLELRSDVTNDEKS